MSDESDGFIVGGCCQFVQDKIVEVAAALGNNVVSIGG